MPIVAYIQLRVMLSTSVLESVRSNRPSHFHPPGPDFVFPARRERHTKWVALSRLLFFFRMHIAGDHLKAVVGVTLFVLGLPIALYGREPCPIGLSWHFRQLY